MVSGNRHLGLAISQLAKHLCITQSAPELRVRSGTIVETHFEKHFGR